MSNTRYIHILNDPPKNPYLDNKAIISDIVAGLARALYAVQRYTLHVNTRSESVYMGISGTALMEYRLAELNLPSELLSSNPDSLNAAADKRLVAVITERGLNREVRDTGHASFIETDVGMAILVLQRFPWTSEKAIKQQWKFSQQLIQNALSLIDVEDNRLTEDSCEVLYGRAGLLYGLLSLRSTYKRETVVDSIHDEDIESLEPLISDETINKVMHTIMRRGKYGAKEYKEEVEDLHEIRPPPLMWAWHYKRYLGAAHGVAGILQVLLQCPAHLLVYYFKDIAATVEWLIACQDKSGNWPAKAPGKHDLPGEDAGDLVQWCHGAPGFIILLATFLRRAKGGVPQFRLSALLESKINTSISLGASLVYHQGLLRKGVGLCHGVAGSIFSLLAAADVSKKPENDKYISRALHLARLATQHKKLTEEGNMRVPDHPWSLYEGMAGMCSAWGELLSRTKKIGPRGCSGMPGFDDL